MNKKHIISAGCFILNPENQIFVFYRGEPFNDIAFPKGKQKPNETLTQTALREVLEETGMKVEIVKLLGVNEYEYYWEPTQETTLKEVNYFLGRVNIEEIKNLNVPLGGKDNIIKFNWIDLTTLKTLVKHKEELDLLSKI